jgi:hypothetical protein
VPSVLAHKTRAPLVEWRRADDTGLQMGWHAFCEAKRRGDDPYALDLAERQHQTVDVS